METLLEQVRDFADKAHGEQRRKYTPDRYIVHPARVMETCKKYSNALPVLAAALLHDVLEDTPVTKEEMQEFLLSIMNKEEATQTLELVIELTDVYTKTAYPKLTRQQRKIKEYGRMEKVSAAAQTIKYADIMDNSKEIVVHDSDFAPVYLHECKTLLEKMSKGNKALHREAFQTVEEGLRQLR
ncbi:MAG: HD domain-containing protein [Chitinophagaceae bacterium]